MRRDDRGSYSLELAISAVLILMFVMLIFGLGRMALASQRVNAAAYEAARAASLERDDSAAAGAGKAAALQSLRDRGLSCSSESVTVDVSAYQPGGQVRAHVTCTARLSDLALSGLPGTKTYRADAVVPVEQYRAE